MRFRGGLWLTLMIVSVGLLSCDRSTIYNETYEIENAQWSYSDTLEARFEVTDTLHYHNVFLNARFSSVYKYSNMYVKVILDGPGGQRLTDVKGFEITDKAGKWLGSGFGNLHSYELPLFENLPLKQIGKYKVKVVQYMRIPELEGIHNRGVKVSLGQEIF